MTEKDNIKELFRSKLNDYQGPVPQDGWQRIEESLAAASRLRVIRRRRIISVAAVIAALIIGGVLFIKAPQSEKAPILSNHIIIPKQQETEQISENNVPGPSSDSNIQSQIEKTDKTAGKILHSRRKNVLTTASKPILVASVSEKMLKSSSQKEALSDIKEEAVIQIIKEKRMAEDRLQINEKKHSELTKKDTDQMPKEMLSSNIKENKRKRPITLALNTCGGLTASQRMTNTPMMLRSSKSSFDNIDDELKEKYLISTLSIEDKAADNIAEMKHDQPISMGFIVSKPFSNRISIETGLVYTYLHSKTRNTSPNFRRKETQQLHYIGIPLNVNYNILSVKNFDIYVSMGGMVEKDIYGKYTYTNTVQGESVNEAKRLISERIRQKNPQFSVNAGIGASYPLYNKLKIYTKIGGVYYFDANNDYKTFYSEKKIVLNLNIGLKVDF